MTMQFCKCYMQTFLNYKTIVPKIQKKKDKKKNIKISMIISLISLKRSQQNRFNITKKNH